MSAKKISGHLPQRRDGGRRTDPAQCATIAVAVERLAPAADPFVAAVRIWPDI